MTWTRHAVEQRLRDALITLRRLPAGRIWPSDIRIAWPEIVREWDSYGWDRAAKPRVQATADDIRRMDEALGWTARWLNREAALRAGLVEDSVKVVMWRAAGRRWDQIGVWRAELWGCRPTVGGGRSAIPGGNSYKSLRQIHDRAIDHLVLRLNGGRVVEAVAAERAEGAVEEVVIVTYPVGETGTYGPVHARAQWVVRERRRR